MPKKYTEREKVLKIYRELPNETTIYIEDVFCADEDIKISQMSISQIKEAIECSIMNLEMDATEDCYEEDEIKDYKQQLKQVKSVYNRYKKWF